MVVELIESLMYPFDVLVATEGETRAQVLVIIMAFFVTLAILGALWCALGDFYRERDGLPPRYAYPSKQRPAFALPRGAQTVSAGRHRKPSILATVFDELVA